MSIAYRALQATILSLCCLALSGVSLASSAPFNDYNGNGQFDDVDISTGFSLDCNQNNVPDECEPDCNNNSIPDECEMLPDCNMNEIPDACENLPDCDNNGVPDACVADCDNNCDIIYGNSADAN